MIWGYSADFFGEMLATGVLLRSFSQARNILEESLRRVPSVVVPAGSVVEFQNGVGSELRRLEKALDLAHPGAFRLFHQIPPHTEISVSLFGRVVVENKTVVLGRVPGHDFVFNGVEAVGQSCRTSMVSDSGMWRMTEKTVRFEPISEAARKMMADSRQNLLKSVERAGHYARRIRLQGACLFAGISLLVGTDVALRRFTGKGFSDRLRNALSF